MNFKTIQPLIMISAVLSLMGCREGANAQVTLSEKIKLNQIGFYPHAEKIGVVEDEKPQEFFIASADRQKKFFSGKLSQPRQSKFSAKKTRIADFSGFNTPGEYVLVIPGIGCSYTFEIKPDAHAALVKASLKSYYFQRFSTALPESYAGQWQRPFSHADDRVLVHASAASAKRPKGTVLSSPRGWIDAGDYNKYIVNSGISMGTLLSAYEDFPAYFDKLETHIPESKNAVPDILDEVLWNLRWMFTMQDPNDGGVYHKCTNASFDKMIKPHEATTPRYVVQKSTAAALDFAAVMAQASRIFQKFEKVLPGLSDSCKVASTAAWQWALANPTLVYDQNAINKNHDPDVTTGEYGDRYLADEFIWAAAELYATTYDGDYLKVVNLLPDTMMPLPSWSQVRLLGYYSLLRNATGEMEPGRTTELRNRIKAMADRMIRDVEVGAYHTVMGSSARDFIWGSNSVAANQGIALIQAYRITHDKKYLAGALSNLDYLLGRNATGYSFITGYGDKTPMHIHHRPSASDDIAEPIPGLLAGGPNPGKQDKCSYPSSIPDEAYVDDVCSYASNEVAINWNAPFVYLAAAMEVLQNESKVNGN